MKKQITASVVAFALALAMPAAAFATVSPEGQVFGTGAEKVQKIDTTTELGSIDQVDVQGNVLNGVTVTTVANATEGVDDVRAQYQATLDKKVADEDLTPAQAAEKAAQWEVQATKYENLVNKYLATDEAQPLDTFVMNGEVKGGTALVTLQFDAAQAKPGDKVTYVILHEDGSIQYATTTVSANGTIQIGMKSFSAFAIINTPAVAVSSEQWIAGVDGSVDGTTAASAKNIENVAAPEKGVSPKTGC